MASGYTAKSLKTLRQMKGSLLEKIQGEFSLIDDQLDISSQSQAINVGPLAMTGTTAWYVTFPCKCDIDKIATVVTTAFDTGAVVTASVVANDPAITDGSLSLAATTDASVAGYYQEVSPTAYNEVAAGASITLTSDGAPSTGSVYFTITYTPKA